MPALFWTPPRLFALAEELEAQRSDAEIARRLSRRWRRPITATAVNLARKRHGLKPRTRRGYTARGVARLLGIGCGKTVRWWIESGRLRGRRRLRRGAYRQWHISEQALGAFLENPDHWHLWDPERISEPGLRHWARDVRASVEYLTTRQVAERCYVEHSAVNAWIHKGVLPAVRHANWLVRASDLEGFVPPGQRVRVGTPARRFTPDEDVRLLALRAEGLSWPAIGARLERQTGSVYGRWHRLQREEAPA